MTEKHEIIQNQELSEQEINSGGDLKETLLVREFDAGKLYYYIKKKMDHSVVADEDDPVYNRLREDLSYLWDMMYKSLKIEESKVREIMKHSNDYFSKYQRAQLKADFTENIPSYKANYRDRDYYFNKIEDRSLPPEEYDRMMREIEEKGSILSRSNHREREFGGGDGSVILSLTNGKIYDVESSEGEKALEEDYQSKRYYTSRSGLSGAGSFYAGRGSLVYLPTSRIDVVHPKIYYKDVNGLEMSMCTNRGVVDEDYPTIIKSGKRDLGVDVVLLSQKKHLQQGGAKDLVDTIETGGENLKDWPVRVFSTKYYDENLEEKEIRFTYKTNMDPKDIPFSDLGKYVFGISRGFAVEQTDSFIDKVVGIRKYKGKYVRLGQFGLIKEVYDEYPLPSKGNKIYYEDIELGDGNEIIHIKEEIKSLAGDPGMQRINGWNVGENFAYKKKKGKYARSKYEKEYICREHGINEDEFVDDERYILVYEDDVSKYNSLFETLGMVDMEFNMEFEYEIPGFLFRKYSIDYRKDYLKKKLIEKSAGVISLSSLPESKQIDLVKKYLKDHQTTVFTLQDSYDSGNCVPGTDRFIRTFSLSESVTGRKLLGHKDLDKMLSIFDFRKVFLKKILSSAL